jgi:hypothetical protein
MTIAQLESNLSFYKKGYNTTVEFILENYKPSTLPRLFYDLKMTVAQIDSNKRIRQHILNDGLKCGFAQDNLFDAIVKDKAIQDMNNKVDSMSDTQILELAELLNIK